ncbi:FkbM family methyltransferase [Sorangium sp. So ce1389]|uniref:FkbM family methyltransferase n=1 Tax=Sorangium sp. So ce1389 TaxID=3133336 RepID=UPI003F6060E2
MTTTPAGVADPAPPTQQRVALMFPGLGDHYVNMGLDLYRLEPVFREQIDRASELLEPELGLDLRSVIYPSPAPEAAAPEDQPSAAPRQGLDLRRMLGRSRSEPSEAEARLNQTRLTQPALFVVELALARLWQSWGLGVGAMIGYSLGEYVAACLAGVLSLEDSLTLVARRAQMIEELPPGAMLAVSLPEEQVAPLLGEHLSLSAINGPELSVVAGPPEAVHELEQRLANSGTATRRVQSSHAFHTPMMAPIAGRLTRLVEGYALKPPQIPYISNVTGAAITAEQATDPAYWAAHLCRPVRFADGLRALAQRPERILLEAGPGQTLSSLAIAHQRGDAAAARLVVASMRHAYDAQPDTAVLLKALSQLRLAGAALEAGSFPALPLHVERGAETAPGPGDEVAETSGLVASAPPEDASAAPQDEPPDNVETQLAASWQRLLSLERVGRDDDFFSLGGNSLVASRLLFRIFKDFRVNVPLRRLYEVRTLAGMAAVIRAMVAEKDGGAAAPSGALPAPGAVPAARTGHAPLRYRLPNGMDIFHQNEAETRHFYEDIFEHRSYVKHGVRIPQGATVFDVGGNIGLFTLFVHTEAPDARIFTFEPAPPLFDLLRRNVAEHRVRAELFNVGISDREREAPFTFYPRSSGMSSFHADEAEEKHVLRTLIANQQRLGMAGMDQILPHSEELLGVRFEATTFTARLRRLSDVIRETGVERIDLLKVDVQKSELEVLEGLDEGDWPRIAQIVLEVHDIGGRLSHLSALLERRGFAITSEQDSLYEGTDIHNIYALRKRR